MATSSGGVAGSRKRQDEKVSDERSNISKRCRLQHHGDLYQGYRFDDNIQSIDKVDASQMDPRDFYESYISKRRPCILTGLHSLSAPSMVELLASSRDVSVQVEKRKSSTERFGQSRNKYQVEMRLSDFVTKCCGCRVGDEKAENTCGHQGLFYLSTQKPEPPASNTKAKDENDDSSPALPFFGPPCDLLRDSSLIPGKLALAGNLVMQSCNLWMGSVDNNPASVSHSGLHHDFHDNFYCLVAGRKRFCLYAPNDVFNLAVAGDVDKCHANGLISYQSNPTRADGVPIVDRKQLDAQKNDEDELQMIFGKGFDYESSEDEGPHDAEDEDDEKDDFDELMSGDNDPNKNNETNDGESIASSGGSDDRLLPDHFSWIDPTVSKEKIAATFPSFKKARSCIIELEAGQSLYLPASWFHCVSSYGTDSSAENGCDSRASGANVLRAEDVVEVPPSVHLAVNYWYHPPDNMSDFSHPYIHREFWEKE